MKKLLILTLVILMPEVLLAKSRTKSEPKALLTLDQVELPKDMEVCFSPDEPCDLKLIKLVNSAEKSLDIAIYDINIDQLVHSVLVKSKSIPVRIVVDQRQSKGSHSLVETLIKAGASVRYGRQRGIMHNKFVIVDGKTVETGSFNFTNHASQANNENQIYITSPAVVERYVNRFETIWDKASDAKKSETK